MQDEGDRHVEFTVQYVLNAHDIECDRRLLANAYSELAKIQPQWLRCRTFAGNDGRNMVFQFAVDDMSRLADLDHMGLYWGTLARRCADAPRTERCDWDCLRTTSLTELATWNARSPVSARR